MIYRIVKHTTPEADENLREIRFRIMHRNDHGAWIFVVDGMSGEPLTFGSADACEDAINHWTAELDEDLVNSWNAAENWEVVKEMGEPDKKVTQ